MKRKPAYLFVFFLLLQGPAQAQESSPADAPLHRTKIEQEQESKAARLTPDKPAKAERDFTKAAYAVKTILEAPPSGIRPKFSSSVPNWGGLALGSGFSVGPQYYRPDLANGEMVLRASAIGTTQGSQKTSGKAGGLILGGGIMKIQKRFSEEEVVNLTLAIAAINGWNRLAISFRAVPGEYQPGVNRKAEGAKEELVRR